MASAEGTRIEALSRVGSGEVCPLPKRLEGLGERRELPQWGPGGNAFWTYFWLIEHVWQSEKCAEQLKKLTIVIWQNSGEARSIQAHSQLYM